MKAGRVVLFGSLFQPPDPFMVRHAEAGASGEEHIWESVCYNDTGRALRGTNWLRTRIVTLKTYFLTVSNGGCSITIWR